MRIRGARARTLSEMHSDQSIVHGGMLVGVPVDVRLPFWIYGMHLRYAFGVCALEHGSDRVMLPQTYWGLYRIEANSIDQCTVLI